MKLDLKRLFYGRTSLIFAIAAPIALVILIAVMVSPNFYSNVRAQSFTVAVYNEDNHPLTEMILKELVESKSLGGLIVTKYVYSDDEGKDAVLRGAAAYIHIPEKMQERLFTEQITVTYYGNPKMPLEDALLFETLSSGMEMVGYATNAGQIFYNLALEHETEPSTAAKAKSAMIDTFFSNILFGRSALYERTAEASPLGGALPLEYFAASLLVLFAALGSLPVARITAGDGAAGLLHRQLLSGRSPLGCFISRWLAGGIFLFIQYAVLAAALGFIAGTTRQGSIPLLMFTGLLLCLFLSLAAINIGLLCKTPALAVRSVFLLSLALALLGGLLLPSAYMPSIVRDISYYSPFSAALKLCIAGMFDKNAQGLLLYTAVLGASTAVLAPMGFRWFQRRAR
ncbi:MAG: ABC transporter permease [Christensenellales bacterium]